MKWNEVFVQPFRVNGIIIWDSQNKICLNSYMNKSSTKKIINKLNGIAFKDNTIGSYTLSENKQIILYNHQEILLIRGWGRLTGRGGLNLPEEEAIKIQDDFAEWIIETLNN